MKLKYRGIDYSRSTSAPAVLPYAVVGCYRGCPVEIDGARPYHHRSDIDRGALQFVYRGVRFQPSYPM
ncbi:MAG: DUF4278 domain-containing protein [Elainellaceae cyanobacterium]